MQGKGDIRARIPPFGSVQAFRLFSYNHIPTRLVYDDLTGKLVFTLLTVFFIKKEKIGLIINHCLRACDYLIIFHHFIVCHCIRACLGRDLIVKSKLVDREV